MLSREWNRGYAAWVAGKPAVHNPYSDGSDRNNAWSEGWITAQYEDFCGFFVQ
jgi:ribosome modulation factor